jgi:potassium-dependent mechanosensitive channel
VGVNYGTDPQRVIALLTQIVNAHPQVVRPPEPFITFDLFGESSLDFTLRFWSRLDQRLQIRSELNTQIAAEFAKNGIVIAFPQRDIHLHLDQNHGSSDLQAKTVRRAMVGE